MNNLTALMSAFARAYHHKNASIKLYDDIYADQILTNDEYNLIIQSLLKGRDFFCPNFNGDDKKLISNIVNNQIGPSVLIRSKIVEDEFNNNDFKQYLILASGYDTSAYKYNVCTYELDLPEMIDDKILRVNRAKINNEKVTYVKVDFKNDWINSLKNTSYKLNKATLCSLLGISYYLSKEEFENTIKAISSVLERGSEIVFDYQLKKSSDKELKNEELAKAANEKMKSTYGENELNEVFNKNNLVIKSHLLANDIDEMFLKTYNQKADKHIANPGGVGYYILQKE